MCGGDVCVRCVGGIERQGKKKLTALRQHDILDLFIGKTDGVGDANVPIRLDRSTDSEEEEYRNGGEESGEADQAVQGQSDLSCVHDAQQEEADGDLGQGQSDERLDPVRPSDGHEIALLGEREVELMAAQSSDGDLAGDQGCSDDGGELKQMLISLRSCLRQQYRNREKTYHRSHHEMIVNPQIPRQLDPDPDPQRRRDQGTRHKSPADGEEGPALAFVPNGWRLEGVFFHDVRAKEKQVQQKKSKSLTKFDTGSRNGENQLGRRERSCNNSKYSKGKRGASSVTDGSGPGGITPTRNSPNGTSTCCIILMP